MQLEQFLREHYDDYVYLKRLDGDAAQPETPVMDIMVKFVPLWILVTYGQCEIEKLSERPAGESPKFRVYDVTFLPF